MEQLQQWIYSVDYKLNKNKVEHLDLDQDQSFTNSHPKQCSKISVLHENWLLKDLKVFARFLSLKISQVFTHDLVVLKSRVCALYKKSDY